MPSFKHRSLVKTTKSVSCPVAGRRLWGKQDRQEPFKKGLQPEGRQLAELQGLRNSPCAWAGQWVWLAGKGGACRRKSLAHRPERASSPGHKEGRVPRQAMAIPGGTVRETWVHEGREAVFSKCLGCGEGSGDVSSCYFFGTESTWRGSVFIGVRLVRTGGLGVAARGGFGGHAVGALRCSSRSLDLRASERKRER